MLKKPRLSPDCILSVLFIALSLCLRFFWLQSRPPGLDIDEANILYWAQKSVQDGQFLLYSPEFTQWEMIPGYFYQAIVYVTGVYRLGPAILGILELIALWFLARRLAGQRVAWIATAFLAVCPWHIFYSRIVGTCTGLSLLILTALLISDRYPLNLLNHIAGLLYYATYRLLILRLILQSLIRREWKRLIAPIGATAVTLILVLVTQSSLKPFFGRGIYNIAKPKLTILSHYLFSLLSPFIPVLDPYAHTTDTFMADYVHAGFTFSLRENPPLGWGLSLTLIVLVLVEVWSLIRRKKLIPMPKELQAEVYFVLGIVAILGVMGPSFSRLLIVVPFLALFAGWAIEQLRARLDNGRYLFVVAVALGSTFISASTVTMRLGFQDLMEPIFNARHQKMAQYIDQKLPSATLDTVWVIADAGYFSARFWANKSGRYSLLPPMEPELMVRHLRYQSKGQEQYILTDQVPPLAEHLSGYDKVTRIKTALSEIRKQSTVLDEKDIVVDGASVGTMTKIRWP